MGPSVSLWMYNNPKSTSSVQTHGNLDAFPCQVFTKQRKCLASLRSHQDGKTSLCINRTKHTALARKNGIFIYSVWNGLPCVHCDPAA
ncbi:hypothetical protein FKM82_017601 [Ascaphus truei]